MIKYTLSILMLLTALNAHAHCPTAFKPEKVCLMLDQNVIFVYDEKLEHNGPYKDFADGTKLLAIKSEGVELGFTLVARGVYRINYAKPLRTVDLEILQAKAKAKPIKTRLSLNVE